MFAVIVASTVQLVTAVGFLLQAVAAYRSGNAAQRAAEDEVARQGVSRDVLSQRGVRFSESGLEMLLPVGIAIILATLASLNLAGVEAGRTLTWIFQPLFLIVAGLVTGGQVFAVRQIQSAFQRSGDAMLQSIDVKRFVDAAMAAFPNGFRVLVVTRFVLTTAGSLLVIVLLALPSADAYYA